MDWSSKTVDDIVKNITGQISDELVNAMRGRIKAGLAHIHELLSDGSTVCIIRAVELFNNIGAPSRDVVRSFWTLNDEPVPPYIDQVYDMYDNIPNQYKFLSL